MAMQLTSDSNLDFRLISLDESGDVDAQGLPSLDELPVIDLSSDQPLPDIPDDSHFSLPSIVSAPAGAAIVRGSSGIWLEGDVLMCACPDCRAPMSIRLWLMIADCWQCGTSIELSEEQEREAKRLLKEREKAKQQAQQRRSAQVAGNGTTSRPAKPRSRAKPQGPPADRRQRKTSKPAAPTTAPPNRRAATAKQPGASAARKRDSQKRVAASQNLARRRVVKKRGLGAWLASLFKDTPAWLVSLVFHLVLLTLLGLLTMPNDDEGNYITLNAIVSSNVRRAGQEEIENPADEVKFDLPVPENVDLNNRRTRESMVRADQDARELRLVDTADPHLPDLEKIKRRIGDADGNHVALVARDPRVRVEVIKQEGGTTLTEAAVARGLRWMAQQQQPDGRWRLDGGTRSDSAGTSLALLPYLGAGQTHLAGRYKDEVSKGLRWLVGQQKEDGDLRAGSSGNSGMYAHGQGAIVLCEAFLMTGDEELRIPAQKAIDFIVEAQNRDGGWRYKPNKECRSAHDRQSDTSVVGWQLMALQSARAANLTVPEESFELASHFLDSVQRRDGALYSYQPNQGVKHTMTAEGLLCRIYLGWTKEDPALMDGAQYLIDNHMPSRYDKNMYYWYYATQTLHHIGGPLWNKWNLKMRDVLVDTQEKGGRYAGSWKPEGGHASAGGRLYMTALATCTLEVYYRHLPIFRQIDVDSHE